MKRNNWKKPRKTQQILQDFETRKAESQLVYNDVKHKNTEVEEEKRQLEKKCRDMRCNVQVMVTKNIHLKALYNKAQCANTGIQEEKQRQEKSQEDTQSLLEELLKRRQKYMHEKNKEVREKTDEKQETLEELEKHCKNLEVQDEHFFTDMTNLIAQNKDLQEICLKKKRKQFGIFWKKDFFPRLASSSSFRG